MLLNQGNKYDCCTSWIEHDEKEWKQSWHRQLNKQKFTCSLLMTHIKKVQTTHNIKNRWTDAGKAYFLLDYPKDWTQACKLYDQDCNNPFEPMLSPPLIEFQSALPSSRYNSKKPEDQYPGKEIQTFFVNLCAPEICISSQRSH